MLTVILMKENFIKASLTVKVGISGVQKKCMKVNGITG